MPSAHEIIKLTVASIALVYFIVQTSLIKFLRKIILSKTGTLILKTNSVRKQKGIAVLITCPILIILPLFTRSTVFISCLMSAVSALACFISVKELVYTKIEGIYKNGIVSSDHFIPFNQIETFPETSWKEPDKEGTTTLAIKLIETKKNKASLITIDYSSILEYVKIIKTLKEIKQNK